MKVMLRERTRNPIQCVEIGEFTTNQMHYYQDTGNRVRDLDVAYKITIPDMIGETDYYFETEFAARKFFVLQQLLFRR